MRHTLIIALALTLAACGSGSDNAQQDQTTKQIDIQPFTTADRAFADVRGDVAECVVVTRDMEQQADTLALAQDVLTTTLIQRFDARGNIAQVIREDTFLEQSVGRSVFSFEFDEAGDLVTSSTDLDGRFNVSRDKNGYVSTFASINNTGDTDYKKLYTWQGDRLESQRIANEHQRLNDDGTPAVMPSDKTTYQYNEKGYLTSEREESGDPTLQLSITDTEYSYLDYDSLGNWTVRDVSRTARVYEIKHGKRQLSDSICTWQRDTRTISYAQP